jgi:hypothetical protein
MGVFRKQTKRRDAPCEAEEIAATNDKQQPRTSSLWQGQSAATRGNFVLRFPSFTPERKKSEQQSHLKRLWALSTQHTQGQWAACDLSLASIHSGSLLMDSANDGHANLQKPQAQDDYRESSLQKIEPWVETLPSSPLDKQIQNDSLTEPSSFCSAFEMLSFHTLCGGDNQAKRLDGTDELPIDADDNASSRIMGVPHEISFSHQDTMDSRLDQLPEELADLEIPDKRTPFFKLIRNIALTGRGSRPCNNNVAKLNLYIEKPKPMEDTNSIENSTITWPNEYRGHGL